MYQDFTYVDDIVRGIENMLERLPAEDENGDRHKVYNIGNNKPEKLIGKEEKEEFLPMQPGDVYQTYADVEDLIRDFDFKPQTSIEDGLGKFVEWYKAYYGLKEMM